MATLKPGSLLDRRYRVVQTLAKGGFGQTYIAEDTRRPGNPRCVVKHLKPASTDSRFLENARRLFSTEAEILEKLGTHDQIPRLLAYFEENQEFYLAQDLIEGHTLTHELQMGYQWSEAQVCQLLRDILNVLAFVHHYGVIHRDIKPENLIRRQQDGKLVLVDFGTVKQVRTQSATQGQISLTIAVGTPGYMPTEQNHGKPRPNSDLYALGIIALQAATGLLPGQLQDDADTGELVWHPWAPQIRLELAVILNHLVRYHFKDRYQSALEVIQALEELFAQHPDLAAEVESQPSPNIVSNVPARLPIRANLSQPIADTSGNLIPPVGTTDLMNTPSPAVQADDPQPIAAAVYLSEEETSADIPTNLWAGQPEITEILDEGQSLQLKLVQPLESSTTDDASAIVLDPSEYDLPVLDPPTPEPSTINSSKVNSLDLDPLVLDPSIPPTEITIAPESRSPDLQLDAISAEQEHRDRPPITRIDSPNRTSPLKSSSALPSRLTIQPLWLGIGVVAIAFLVGIPLVKILVDPQSRIAQAPGFRTIFTPAQQSLSKVLLSSLPCEAVVPDAQLSNPVTYSDGTQYYGTLSNGLFNDPQGVVIFTDGSRYDGALQKGQFNGCGQYTYPEAESYHYYSGQFRNNAFNGLGTLVFDGGDRYIGEFRNGKCHGRGTFIFSNGLVKRSDWREGTSTNGDSALSCSRQPRS